LNPLANLDAKHLRYLWAVAKCGSFAVASKQLHLTPRFIRSQLRVLE
jgi:DNA-binding transcriptional LysR family regulator